MQAQDTVATLALVVAQGMVVTLALAVAQGTVTILAQVRIARLLQLQLL